MEKRSEEETPELDYEYEEEIVYVDDDGNELTAEELEELGYEVEYVDEEVLVDDEYEYEVEYEEDDDPFADTGATYDLEEVKRTMNSFGQDEPKKEEGFLGVLKKFMGGKETEIPQEELNRLREGIGREYDDLLAEKNLIEQEKGVVELHSADLEERLSELESTIEDLESDIEEKEIKITELEEEKETLLGDTDGIVSDLEAEISELKEDLEKSVEMLEEYSDIEEALQSKNKELETKSEELESCKASLEELELRLDAEVEKLKTEKESLLETFGDSEAEYKSRIEELEQKNLELEGYKEKYEDQEHENGELLVEVESLRQERELLETELDEYRGSDIDRLMMELEKERLSKSELRSDLVSKVKEINTQKRKLVLVGKEYKILKGDLEDHKKLEVELNSKIDKLKEDKEKIELEVLERDELIRDIESEMQVMEGLIEEYKKTIEELDKSNEIVLNDLVKLSTDYDDIVADYEYKLDRKDTELVESYEKIDEMNAYISKLEIEAGEAKDRLELELFGEESELISSPYRHLERRDLIGLLDSRTAELDKAEEKLEKSYAKIMEFVRDGGSIAKDIQRVREELGIRDISDAEALDTVEDIVSAELEYLDFDDLDEVDLDEVDLDEVDLDGQLEFEDLDDEESEEVEHKDELGVEDGDIEDTDVDLEIEDTDVDLEIEDTDVDMQDLLGLTDDEMENVIIEDEYTDDEFLTDSGDEEAILDWVDDIVGDLEFNIDEDDGAGSDSDTTDGSVVSDGSSMVVSVDESGDTQVEFKDEDTEK